MMIALDTRLGRIAFNNPILTASGTFGYAKELEGTVDFSQLGGIIPKTITVEPRIGNPPPRTLETPSGLLNAIGLDNDGLEYFLENHLPYLLNLPTAIVVNIAGKTQNEFVLMCKRLSGYSGITALELNLSCPNVSGGIDFAVNPLLARTIVEECRAVTEIPLIAKLSPLVANIVEISRAVADGGADAVSIANTFPAMAINWRQKKPVLGNKTGGLSGPAIKPIILKLVWEVARANVIPIIAVGGIASIDDIMEYGLAGASAVQVGTSNFYQPQHCSTFVHNLPDCIASLGYHAWSEMVGACHKM
ncbi:MAG: dihydroorotate dehydrogenase [Zavarzinella sp.]